MKYWLIFMIFSNEGEFLEKRETELVDAQMCVIEAALESAAYVNTGLLTSSYCVTDDHYNGRSQDEGIPLD